MKLNKILNFRVGFIKKNLVTKYFLIKFPFCSLYTFFGVPVDVPIFCEALNENSGWLVGVRC